MDQKWLIRRTSRRLGVLLAVFSMIVVSAVVVAPTDEVDAQSSNFLMKGQILRDGEGVRGMDVVAFLQLPTDESLPGGQALRTAEEVNLPVATAATSRGNGNFSLTLGRNEIPETFIDNDDAVNFMVLVYEQGELLAVHNSTLYAPALNHKGRRVGPWTTQNADGFSQNARSLRVEIDVTDPGGEFEVTEDGLTEDEFNEDLQEPVLIDEGGEPIENQYWYCNTTNLGEVDLASTIMTITGSNSRYVSYDYEFNETASVSDSVTLGVGFSWTNSSAGWSETGTTKVTTSYRARYATNSGPNHTAYRVNTRYDRFREVCTGASGTSTFYQVKPIGTTGAHSNNTLGQTPTYCSIIEHGAELTYTTGRVTSLSQGVTVTGPLGTSNGTVRLSVRNNLEGGSSHAITFKNVANHTDKWVCGTTNYPGIGNSGRMAGDWRDR